MQASFRFQNRDYISFFVGLFLLASGFLCMGLDPDENGFGVLTLWIAPVLLLLGFSTPVIGILGIQFFKNEFLMSNIKVRLKGRALPVVAGFIAFALSLMVYLLTMEPTASLWDCSEFIAAAYKLQVPHTPGNPLFLLIGRVFAMFSFGDVYRVAVALNVMSAVFSSLAVLILFHMIWMLLNGIGAKANLPDWIITMASFSGAMSMAFIDTFWFSAVEAEIYAAASFFLFFNAWLGLVSLKIKDPEVNKRWKILTAYVVGLSYCVHPMCLLAIPFIGMVWYLRQKEFTARNLLVSILLGFGVLLVINRLVAVSMFEMAFYFDLMAVNVFGLAFYSGVILFILLIGMGVFLLLSKKQKWKVGIWSFVFLVLGFSSYLLLFIRSNYNPPIDEHNPENMAMIKAYMNRESYGSRPLVYGPYFDAEIKEFKKGGKVYYKTEEGYKVAGNRSEYVYEEKRQTILPRMYSKDDAHVQQYKAWTGLGENEKPGFIQNIKFMFQYQLGHMYWRYLMWNFSGRVSDIQHDSWLKPWQSVSVELENRARNQYWMIPFLVGMAGMFFHYQRDRKSFFSMLLFFLTTGIILNLYLNSLPNEPRERDYIYVGSFMVYCVWIGLGIIAIWDFLRKKNVKLAITAVISISLFIPAILFYMNWDDHNRSGRTLQMDSARNLLNTCEQNAILFTGGDNDTFPLWYLQEVEGVRTDVRVIVLSYFNTDWYIGQLRKKYYESDPFQLTLSQKDYVQFGRNDVLYYRENPKVKGAINAAKYLELLEQDHPSLQLATTSGEIVHQISSKELYIPVDTSLVLKRTNLPEELKGRVQGKMILKMKQHYLEKNALVLLDLIISNHWERPIYFNYTSMNSIGLDVSPYLVQEGQVFQLLPVRDSKGNPQVNMAKMKEHIVGSQDFDNLKDPRIYFNHEDYLSRIMVPLQQYHTTLAISYFNSGNPDAAREVMYNYMDLFHHDHLPGTYVDLQAVQVLLALGESEKAKMVANKAAAHFSMLNACEEMDSGNDQVNRYIEGQFYSFLDRINQK